MLASAGAATALGAVTVAGAANSGDSLLVPVVAGWWLLAAALGLWLGRPSRANRDIARALAEARAATSLPEQRPGLILLNRLWPLLLFTLLSGGLAFLAPQIPAIAAGFAIIWSLAWRRQDGAVAAIEERDGASFYVRRTSPVRPMELVRTPGFKSSRAERVNGAVT